MYNLSQLSLFYLIKYFRTSSSVTSLDDVALRCKMTPFLTMLKGNRRCQRERDGWEPWAGWWDHWQPASHGPGHGTGDWHPEPPDRQDHGEGTVSPTLQLWLQMVHFMMYNVFRTISLHFFYSKPCDFHTETLLFCEFTFTHQGVLFYKVQKQDSREFRCSSFHLGWGPWGSLCSVQVKLD